MSQLSESTINQLADTLVSDVIDLGTGGLFADLLEIIYLANIWNFIELIFFVNLSLTG